MVKCDFCGRELPRGTGTMFVKKDGKILYFCSTKCEKNTNKLNKKARETKWTNEFHKIKGIELAAKGKQEQAKKTE